LLTLTRPHPFTVKAACPDLEPKFYHMKFLPQLEAKNPAMSQLLTTFDAPEKPIKNSPLSNMMDVRAQINADFSANMTLKSLVPSLFSPSVAATAPRGVSGGLYGAAGYCCSDQPYTNATIQSMMPAPLRHPLCGGGLGTVTSIIGALVPAAGSADPSRARFHFTNHALASSPWSLQQ
jgi:hypothetical protein